MWVMTHGDCQKITHHWGLTTRKRTPKSPSRWHGALQLHSISYTFWAHNTFFIISKSNSTMWKSTRRKHCIWGITYLAVDQLLGQDQVFMSTSSANVNCQRTVGSMFCEYLRRWPCIKYQWVTSQQTQNICVTFVQRRTNVFDVGATLYKCYTNVLCLLG